MSSSLDSALPLPRPRLLAAALDSAWQATASHLLLRLAALGLLAALIGYPILMLIKASVVDDAGELTLRTFGEVLSLRGMGSAAVNSLWLVVSVTAGCLALGIPLAWLVARTDLPGKALVMSAAGISFVVPSFVTVISWLFLAAPHSGYLNFLLSRLWPSGGPLFNIVSFPGLVFVETIHLYPLVFFGVVAGLSNIDASQEQAASILGAGPLRKFMTVTLPLVAPAVVSSTIFCMLDVLSSFGAPAAIGMMANFSVLTTKIYALMMFPPRLEMAAAASMPIVAFTLLCLVFQRLYLGRASFATIGGKFSPSRSARLGAWRMPLVALVAIFGLATSLLPLAALVILSLLRAFGLDVTLDNLVITHYAMLFNDSFHVTSAIKNSLLLACCAATACLVLGIFFAWIVERTSMLGRGMITVALMVAYGFPAIAFAVGVALGYVNILYGTLGIILVAYISKTLPLAFVFIRNAMKQISCDLEQAARICGATALRSVVDITLPLMKTGIWIAWLVVFSLCLRELTMSALLTQANTAVMSTVAAQLIENGSVEDAAATSVLIVIICVCAAGAVKWLSDRGTSSVQPPR
jgi:iron(III) transport system permease protein